MLVVHPSEDRTGKVSSVALLSVVCAAAHRGQVATPVDHDLTADTWCRGAVRFWCLR